MLQNIEQIKVKMDRLLKLLTFNLLELNVNRFKYTVMLHMYFVKFRFFVS